MDHDATREQLDLAAVEPGGLERLMAGDTVTAQAVAAHLAGCPSCTEELARLQRAATLISGVLREMPPQDLRARTLAAIRTEGVQRPIPMPSAPPGDAAAVSVAPTGGRRGVRVVGWVAAVAAAVVLSVVATSVIVGSRVDDQLAAQAATIRELEEVTTATLAVTAQPDAEHVVLTGVSDPKQSGSLVFSPASAELVVVATGLTVPPAGLEYRCWVEVDGTRHGVGKMFFGGQLAYWVGPAPAVSGVSSGATFGVSLVDASGPAVSTDPVLLGRL
jgi:negative regulator of sigma E activity